MTYGAMHTTTKELLQTAALEQGWFDKVTWPDELDWEEIEDEGDVPENLYQFAVIFEGALDEEFYLATDYEVNIAELLAQSCRDEAASALRNDDSVEIDYHESTPAWEVVVTEYAYEDAGPVKVKITSGDTHS